jgi:hypothetical protein
MRLVVARRESGRGREREEGTMTGGTLGQWASLVAAVALLTAFAAGILAVMGAVMAAVLSARGGALRRRQSVRLACPMRGQAVECEIVQDVRTGQWKEVRACSAFDPPHAVTCDRDCTAAMNLGFGLGARLVAGAGGGAAGASPSAPPAVH